MSAVDIATHALLTLAEKLDLVRSSAEQLVQQRLGQQASAVLKGRYLIAKYCSNFVTSVCAYNPLLACGILSKGQIKIGLWHCVMWQQLILNEISSSQTM